MTVETWTSDKGNEEVHHFLDDGRTYLFGCNKRLLGEGVYRELLRLVQSALEAGAAKQRTL